MLNTLREAVVADCSATGEMYGGFKMTNPQALGQKGGRQVNLVGGEKSEKPADGSKRDAVA